MLSCQGYMKNPQLLVNLMQYDLFSARIVSGSDINNNNDVPHKALKPFASFDQNVLKQYSS